MNTGLGRFYGRMADMYKKITNSNNYLREEYCPQAYIRELTEDQVKDAQKPWILNSLPSINMKASNLLESPEHLERLN